MQRDCAHIYVLRIHVYGCAQLKYIRRCAFYSCSHIRSEERRDTDDTSRRYFSAISLSENARDRGSELASLLRSQPNTRRRIGSVKGVRQMRERL